MSESKKLVDILARDLVHWHYDADKVRQVEDGRLYMYKEGMTIGLSDAFFEVGEEVWNPAGFVSKDQWQAARNALLAAEAVHVWSGEGIPGAGQSCNIRFTDHPGSSPHPVTILAFGERKVFYRDAQGDEFLHDREYVAYSPIRTPEQIKADEREQAIKDLYFTINWADDPDIWPRISNARKADYARAIDAGYAKVDQ